MRSVVVVMERTEGNRMVNPFQAAWKVTGQVAERRMLTSQKNAEWRGYVVKIATTGLTLEINVAEREYSMLADGMVVVATGRFEDQAGRLKLSAQAIEVQK